MKRILITGKDSYIGTSFEKWVRQWPEEYPIDTLDTKEDWQSYDLATTTWSFTSQASPMWTPKPTWRICIIK